MTFRAQVSNLSTGLRRRGSPACSTMSASVSCLGALTERRDLMDPSVIRSKSYAVSCIHSIPLDGKTDELTCWGSLAVGNNAAVDTFARSIQHQAKKLNLPSDAVPVLRLYALDGSGARRKRSSKRTTQGMRPETTILMKLTASSRRSRLICTPQGRSISRANMPAAACSLNEAAHKYFNGQTGTKTVRGPPANRRSGRCSPSRCLVVLYIRCI